MFVLVCVRKGSRKTQPYLFFLEKKMLISLADMDLLKLQGSGARLLVTTSPQGKTENFNPVRHEINSF